MSELEHVHERVLLQRSGVQLEFIYRPDVQRLIIQVTVMGGEEEEHTVEVTGNMQILETGTSIEQARLELTGAATSVLWAKIARRVTREAPLSRGGDDTPTDQTPRRLPDGWEA